MNTLDCTDIKALLSALIDDQLDPHTRHLVERHLAGCDGCREHINEHERLDSLVALSGQLALHARPDLPGGFENEVLARTVRAEATAYSIFGGVVTWTGWCAAAASIALAAFIWVTDRGSSSAVPGVPGLQVGAEHAVSNERETRFARYMTGEDLQSSVIDVVFDSPERFRFVSRPVIGDSPDSATPGDFVFVSELPGPAAAGASTSQRFQRAAPAISRDEADALYNVSLLMHILSDADATTFADVENVRRVILADDLIGVLGGTRHRLDPADRPALLAAESVLVRIVDGPLDSDDVRYLSETVAQLDLFSEIGDITYRWDRAWSM